MQKPIAILFVLIALGLGIAFFLQVEFPTGITAYFKKDYYSQFGPLAICIELLFAGYYLFKKHPKTNFALALFGFTVLLDAIFNWIGLITTMLPVYTTIIFICCALVSFWLAFTDTFKLGRISFVSALVSFILGNAVELFFNYW